MSQIYYGYDELPFDGMKATGFRHAHGPKAVNDDLENKGAGLGGLDWK